MDVLSGEMISRYLNKRKQVLAIAVLVMMITTVPYLIGFASEGEGWRYTGFVVGVEDGNSYIAKMLSGSTGAWLFRTPYSTMEQKGVIAFLPYILLGKLAAGAATHYQLVVLYHCFRLIGGVLAILAAYDLISLYLSKTIWKYWALAIYVLGGGGGWILIILEEKNFLGSLPLDFISPESFGFLGLFGFPHLAFARAMLLWGIVIYLEKRSGYLTGLLWIILGLMQPMYVVVAWCVLGTHNVLQLIINGIKRTKDERMKADITNTIKAIILSSPLIIYTAYEFFTDPYLSTWAKQNTLPSPHFVHYLIAYGLYLPLAVLGIRDNLLKENRLGLLLMGWLGILPVLVYAPVSTQRRLAEGIWIVITIGMIYFLENRQRSNITIKSLLYLTFPSTIIFMIGAILSAKTVSTPLFRPVEEIKMFQKIGRSAESNSVVLSSFETGNNLPAWIPFKVVLGHGPETAGNKEIKGDVLQLYSIETDEHVRSELIRKYRADYLIVGPAEKEIGSWNAAESELLYKIYHEGDYEVYKTLNDHGN